jgi:hypothetical protein
LLFFRRSSKFVEQASPVGGRESAALIPWKQASHLFSPGHVQEEPVWNPFSDRRVAGVRLVFANSPLIVPSKTFVSGKQKLLTPTPENLLDSFGIYRAIRDETGDIVDFQIEYVNYSVRLVTRR